jgi:hypothetical protein
LIEQETLKKEYRISNNECRMSKEGNHTFEILRFDILLFCGSLFRAGEVSYKEDQKETKKKINHESTPVE